MSNLILSIDQGTTSSRAIVFDTSGIAVATAQQEFKQYFPASGWVEHDPEDIWSSTQNVCKQVLAKVDKVAVIGITNQRETILVWNRETGQAIHKAIVWQDTRTADICAGLKQRQLDDTIKQKTGLVIDPYFSATKVAWMLDKVEGARELAQQGKLAFGTVDSFLIWRLTNGQRHVTDATNASRTLLFNIHTQQWDEELLDIFNIPANMLPEVLDCAADFGTSSEQAIGQKIPIGGVAGDQQAAAFGQCCFQPGSIKSTYGTGSFALMNTGSAAVDSSSGLLSTVSYRINGNTTYALEGSIFIAGAAVQWLRDRMQIVQDSSQTETHAQQLASNDGVYLVPAFVGLGAPYWNPNARGAIFGLTRDTGPEHFSRAALESVCYQTYDLMQAMSKDTNFVIDALRVDGGMVANRWMCQMLANILNIDIELPVVTETTALGAAYLAGLQAGLFKSIEEIQQLWLKASTFKPEMESELRDKLLKQWKQAVTHVDNMAKEGF